MIKRHYFFKATVFDKNGDIHHISLIASRTSIFANPKEVLSSCIEATEQNALEVFGVSSKAIVHEFNRL